MTVTPEQFRSADRQGKATIVANHFGLDRNTVLYATVESMVAAMEADDPALLRRKNGDALATKPLAIGGDLADVIAKAIEGRINPGIDRVEVAKLVNELIERRLSTFVGHANVVAIQPHTNGPIINCGPQHKNFAKLAKRMGRRENVILVGPAGSGKSVAPFVIAEKLQLQVYPVSCGEQTTKTDVFGYMDMSGNYVAGPMYTAFKQGGVLIFDEFDRINPGVGVMANNALSNRKHLFPNGEFVVASDQLIFVVTCNTLHGATAEYTTAKRQDASTLNRFAVIEWPVDEEFELALAGPDGAEWCRFVQKARRKINELGIKSKIITPRTTLYGMRDLKSGDTRQEVEDAYIFAGMPDTDETKLRAAVRS